MLSGFDWVRRTRTGAELLAVMDWLNEHPGDSTEAAPIGPPHIATGGPCRRCWIYPRGGDNSQYCETCRDILRRSRHYTPIGRRMVLIWGFTNQLPEEVLHPSGDGRIRYPFKTYIHDDNRFLVALERNQLKHWMQDLTLYHGLELRGILQIFPTMGAGTRACMGDVLCRAIHRDLYLPMGEMHVLFFSRPYQLFNPRRRSWKGMLTFELSEFLYLLEMAEIFRVLLRPEEQQELLDVLRIGGKEEFQFYWGRFLGRLEQRPKDMLTAWGMRQWPKNRINLFYELLDYVRLIYED